MITPKVGFRATKPVTVIALSEMFQSLTRTFPELAVSSFVVTLSGKAMGGMPHARATLGANSAPASRRPVVAIPSLRRWSELVGGRMITSLVPQACRADSDPLPPGWSLRRVLESTGRWYQPKVPRPVGQSVWHSRRTGHPSRVTPDAGAGDMKTPPAVPAASGLRGGSGALLERDEGGEVGPVALHVVDDPDLVLTAGGPAGPGDDHVVLRRAALELEAPDQVAVDVDLDEARGARLGRHVEDRTGR